MTRKGEGVFVQHFLVGGSVLKVEVGGVREGGTIGCGMEKVWEGCLIQHAACLRHMKEARNPVTKEGFGHKDIPTEAPQTPNSQAAVAHPGRVWVWHKQSPTATRPTYRALSSELCIMGRRWS